ncbi:MAG TPA: CBS domain-containing protein [Actinomycetota bacterium]|nr:CBS domain-containing protein [Actinomycetota bacterium]
MRRRVSDVMTRTVAVVSADTPFKEIARRLSEHRVAALPVVDGENRAIGIVSEADLLLKEEHPQPEEHPRRPSRRTRRELERAEGVTAREVMTSPVATVRPDSELAEAARAMHAGGFRSMPVVDAEGMVVGIVARRDLLRVFLRADEDIRNEIVHEVVQARMWIDPNRVSVSVNQGVVTLRGQLERASNIPILVHLAYGVEGVVRVVEHLSSEFDDANLRPAATAPWGIVPMGAR